MILIYWRGLLWRRVAKLLDRWAWSAESRAKRDLGRSIRPQGDLFDRPQDWGGR